MLIDEVIEVVEVIEVIEVVEVSQLVVEVEEAINHDLTVGSFCPRHFQFH